MKKILLFSIIIFVSGCAPLNKNLHEKFEINYGNMVTYCDGFYYFHLTYPDENLYRISNDNIKTVFENSFLIKENDMLYLENNSNSKLLLGEIDEKDYNNNYIIPTYGEDKFDEYKTYINNNYVLSFRFEIDSSFCINPYLLNNSNGVYILSIKYKNKTYTDMSINGEDYINSELYKIDFDNEKLVLIYSTDNTTAIAYGNDNAVYYADDKYDIYRLDFQTNETKLVYDTPQDDGIIVDYSYNKLFIFDDEDNVGIIDIE